MLNFLLQSDKQGQGVDSKAIQDVLEADLCSTSSLTGAVFLSTLQRKKRLPGSQMQTKSSSRGRGQEASSLESPLFAGLSGLRQTQSCSVSTPQLVFFPLISLPYSCLKAVLVSGFKWLSYCFGILIMDL